MKAVPQPEVRRILLTEWDDSGETWVEIRETRIAEAAARDAEIARIIVEHGRDTSREIYDLSNGTRIITECRLSFANANLTLKSANGDVQPLFWAGMSDREFTTAFGFLPVSLALEWHAAVLQVNPQWRLRME